MQREQLLHPSSIIELTGISFLGITDNMDLPVPAGSDFASNSSSEKISSENEVVSGDDFGATLEKFNEVWSYHAIFHTNVKFPGH